MGKREAIHWGLLVDRKQQIDEIIEKGTDCSDPFVVFMRSSEIRVIKIPW
jgi:hypothetical protein